MILSDDQIKLERRGCGEKVMAERQGSVSWQAWVRKVSWIFHDAQHTI